MIDMCIPISMAVASLSLDGNGIAVVAKAVAAKVCFCLRPCVMHRCSHTWLGLFSNLLGLSFSQGTVSFLSHLTSFSRVWRKHPKCNEHNESGWLWGYRSLYCGGMGLYACLRNHLLIQIFYVTHFNLIPSFYQQIIEKKNTRKE